MGFEVSIITSLFCYFNNQKHDNMTWNTFFVLKFLNVYTTSKKKKYVITWEGGKQYRPKKQVNSIQYLYKTR